MFKKARLELTGWYLLIIVFISLIFSGLVYTTTTQEIERGFRRAEIRFGFSPNLMPGPPQISNPFLIKDYEAAKQRVLLKLATFNGIILVFSAAAAYFLAGKTLAPIESALEKQKRFIADASHELRTPLAASRTSIEVALRKKRLSQKEAKMILKSNLEDTESLISLTNNLLSLTRYEHNSLLTQSVIIKEIIHNAVKKILPLAKDKKIMIKIKADKTMIKGNREALEKMLVNFLDNAVKYTPKGGKVKISTENQSKYLLINIKDTGIGIPAKDLPHIFDRFYRVDQSRSKDITGFGLGLSVAKKIIEIHRGSITVKSKPKKGTHFTIRLPLYK